ncbi:MAG: radical SAM protein [Humidesulfovibrio sp.]|nr:radical SAM protein [Humidesulfovibrio sp.]
MLGHQLGRPSAGRPYRLVVEISNACNLRCAMCPRNTMTRKVQFMDFEFFQRLMRENRDILEFVGLNGYGEPLLHPELPRMLDCCRELGIKTGISTNCTLLDEKRARMLLDSPPDQLTLAVDGVDAAHYEQVRVGAAFDQVMENVRGFLRMKGHNRPPYTILQCIHMPETRHAVPSFRNAFAGLGFDAIRIRQLTFSGRDRGEDYVNDSSSCYWLWNEPMVLASGQLSPCCQDVNGALALGDLHQTPLRELWAADSVVRMRRLHAHGQRNSLALCRDCNMYQPSVPLRLGAQLLNTYTVNRMVPTVETWLSVLRYGRKGNRL